MESNLIPARDFGEKKKWVNTPIVHTPQTLMYVKVTFYGQWMSEYMNVCGSTFSHRMYDWGIYPGKNRSMPVTYSDPAFLILSINVDGVRIPRSPS